MTPRKRSAESPAARRRLTLRLAVLALTALGIVAAAKALAPGDTEAGGLDRALDSVMLERGVDRARVASTGGGQDDPVREVSIPLPDGESYSTLNADIARAVEEAGGTVLDAVEQGPHPERPASLEVQLGRGGQVTHRVEVRPESRRDHPGEPRIALVFDDLGYRMDGLAAELLALDVPLTFAVLPGLAHSADFAREADRRGHDVILHLPMEPSDAHRHDPGRDALLTSLSAEENRERLLRQLDQLPHFKGISNHMGSRATANPELVDLVLGELRQRDRSLFFFDSRTSPYSVVTKRARRQGVPTAANNVFLDTNDEDGVVATDQTARVAAIARRHGSAIAIGHVRPETVEAVRAALPEWRRAGIRLVPLSDLMHR